MSISVGGSNETFRYATNPEFDMSSGTATFTLKFTNEAGVQFTVTGSRITAPAVQVDDDDLGLLTASTYMQMQTIVTDFTTGGEWTACSIYEDSATTPVTKFFGSDVTFTVLDDC